MRWSSDAYALHGSRLAPLLGLAGMTGWGVWQRAFRAPMIERRESSLIAIISKAKGKNHDHFEAPRRFPQSKAPRRAVEKSARRDLRPGAGRRALGAGDAGAAVAAGGGGRDQGLAGGAGPEGARLPDRGHDPRAPDAGAV